MTQPHGQRERPLLVYDGECDFCRRWVARWRSKTGDDLDYEPSQEVGARFPEIPQERFRQAVVLIEPDGGTTSGAEAVFRTLCHAPGRRWGAKAARWAYGTNPVFRRVTEGLYRFVARHRGGFSILTTLLWGEEPTPSTMRGRSPRPWMWPMRVG